MTIELPASTRTLTSRRAGQGIGHSAGFTLLEMLAVPGLITLVLGISVVSISGIQDEDRLRRAASQTEPTAR